MFRRFALLPLLVAFAACDDAAPVGPVDNLPLPRLENSVWYAHAANGAAMPALLREETVGSSVEQDFADSLRFEIHADGGWTKSVWHNRFRDGIPAHWAAHHETGRWEIREDGYAFLDAAGLELFLLAAPPTTELNLPFRYIAGVASRSFVLRPQLTPPTFHGRWRATTLNGVALPAQLYGSLDEEYPSGPMSWSIVVDSAYVVLHPNGRFVQRIHYSEYQGEAGQQPTKLFGRFTNADYGAFNRNGVQLTLVSGWLSGHFMSGAVASSGAGGLTLNHGLTHGDPPALFQYQR